MKKEGGKKKKKAEFSIRGKSLTPKPTFFCQARRRREKMEKRREAEMRADATVLFMHRQWSCEGKEEGKKKEKKEAVPDKTSPSFLNTLPANQGKKTREKKRGGKKRMWRVAWKEFLSM